ncbi:MAG: sigma-70 family RNA polymerase sigma factor [Clostridia bacterium]|nr:sigma-70 family RNA polymerase sigma factor [Clostridia bacterium]
MQSMDKEKVYLEKARCGDGEAFGELVRFYESFVYNTAYGFMLNPDDAFDVAQDAFLKAWRGIKDFKGSSAFSTWLYRITVNTAKDALALKKKRGAELSSTLEEGEILDTPDLNTPETAFIEKESREELKRAIDSLDDSMREIIILRELNEMSYEEISEALDTELGTVKSRLSRAREKLREKILEQKENFSVK